MNLTPETIASFGASIFKACANADEAKLREIRQEVYDPTDFRQICNSHTDSSTGRNVLHYAALLGHLHVCAFLIHNVGAYIEATTHKGDTPLIEAAKEGQYEIADFLIQQGAALGACNAKGTTALHYALSNGYWSLMELLIKRGAPVNADSVGGTPLQIAVYLKSVSPVRYLLANGAKPNFCCMDLVCPLAYAVKAQWFECLGFLLTAKADPNMFFPGCCPLSYAARGSDIRFLKSLLEAGANPNTPNIGDLAAIEEAALARNREGVEILFPLSKRIESYPEWSVDGIMEYCHSEKAKTEREAYKKRCVVAIGRVGNRAMGFKRYNIAALHFKIATHYDPTNPTWTSKQSLCNAHANRCALALYDVERFLRFELHMPGPHPGDADAAACISKNFVVATYARMLYPQDATLSSVFRLCVFDYFVWLYMLSSPEEIHKCSRRFLELSKN